ncbi:MAG: YMGG-like glycine zipper-containing protein [Verrucomicrobiota bacterium]
MKHLTLGLLSIVAAASLSSCATGPNAQTGTVIGALGGAAAGGIIGNQSGRGLEGAAIGAGLGALAGNAIGDSSDRRNSYYGNGYYNNGYYNRGYARPGYYSSPGYGPGYYPAPSPYYGY